MGIFTIFTGSGRERCTGETGPEDDVIAAIIGADGRATVEKIKDFFLNKGGKEPTDAELNVLLEELVRKGYILWDEKLGGYILAPRHK